MARKERIYQRLPGRPLFPFASWSLWQGPDHLLYVKSIFFREQYKRFYYNDIQALLVQRTNTHWVWTFVWGGLAFLFGLIAFFQSDTPYVSGTFTAGFIAALLTNIIMGPSCTVHLQTAVQLQRLVVLRRERKAHRVLNRVKALVEASQGTWERSKSLDAQRSTLQTTPDKPVETLAAPAVLEKTQEPQGAYSPVLHQILFGLFLILGVFGGLQIVLKSLYLSLFETLLHAGAQILVIVALVRWFRHLKGTLIAKFNWMALIFIAIQTIIGYGLFMVVSIRNPEINYHHWAMFKMMFELTMSDHPLALAGNIIYAGGSLLLGVFGLMVVQRHGSGPAKPVPTPEKTDLNRK